MLGLHHRHRAAGDGERRGVLSRRDWLAAAAGLLAGCTLPPRAADWSWRLAGDRVALLGEVHDNPALHAERLRVLKGALDAGWRPAVAMEQFDVDRQAELERARAERPGDVEHLIERATGGRRGWDWDHYRALIALVLARDLPLVAADLPDALARRLVREDAAQVFGTERARELALDGPGAIRPDAAWRAAQRDEIDAGHCHALPASLLPGMVRAQFARDAVMAEAVARHAARGVVLLAGNGHVRRDLGVPRWLRGIAPARVWSVGFLESDAADVPRAAFDAVVLGPRAARGDPCERVAPPR